MYLVYTDEAGTAANEAITIVVSYIVAEKDVLGAIKLVEDLFDEYVPSRYRNGFEFHAYKVWGDPCFREGWPIEARSDFISALASVPRVCNGAISIGKVRRDSGVPDGIPQVLTAPQFQHMMAFTSNVARADKYVRDWGSLGSLAIVVAEDIPEMRSSIRAAFRTAKEADLELPMDARYLRLTAADMEAGKILQTAHGKAERIIDTVHFATRKTALLLQVADACAFVFRRYLNRQSRGEEWAVAMLGDTLNLEDWGGPSSNVYFRFHNSRHN